MTGQQATVIQTHPCIATLSKKVIGNQIFDFVRGIINAEPLYETVLAADIIVSSDLTLCPITSCDVSNADDDIAGKAMMTKVGPSEFNLDMLKDLNVVGDDTYAYTRNGLSISCTNGKQTMVTNEFSINQRRNICINSMGVWDGIGVVRDLTTPFAYVP